MRVYLVCGVVSLCGLGLGCESSECNQVKHCESACPESASAEGRLVLDLQKQTENEVVLTARNVGKEPLTIDKELVIGFDVRVFDSDGIEIRYDYVDWGDVELLQGKEVVEGLSRRAKLNGGESLVRVIDLRRFRCFSAAYSSTMRINNLILHTPTHGFQYEFGLPADRTLGEIKQVEVVYSADRIRSMGLVEYEGEKLDQLYAKPSHSSILLNQTSDIVFDD